MAPNLVEHLMVALTQVGWLQGARQEWHWWGAPFVGRQLVQAGGLSMRAGRRKQPACSPCLALPHPAPPAAPAPLASLQVRTVPVQTTAVSMSELQVRAPRVEELSSVEASLRLDAVASAGFRISRGKMTDLIKGGGCALGPFVFCFCVDTTWGAEGRPGLQLGPG